MKPKIKRGKERGPPGICSENKIELSFIMKMKFLLPLVGLLLAGCATRTYTTTTPPAGPTLAEVQTMVQAHVSDSVIVSQIQNSSTRYFLTASQIIELKNADTSDAVITALINSASKPEVKTTTVNESSYVYPYVYVDPWPWVWWGGGPYYHGGGHRHWR